MCCSCENINVQHFDNSIDKNELPIVYIDSDDIGVNLNRATMKIEDNNTPNWQLYNGNIEIRLRGHSTAFRDKHPYKIKLEIEADLFGMGRNKHWVLLANDLDHTQIRNKITFDLARDIGMDNASESKLVSLILNGEYQGVYLLAEQIRVDRTRVNIYDWKDTFSYIAENEIVVKHLKDINTRVPQTGGFIIEGNSDNFKGYLSNNEYNENVTNVQDKMTNKLFTDWYMPLQFNTPDNVYPDTELYQYAYNYIQSFEYSLHSPDYIYHSNEKHYMPTNMKCSVDEEGRINWTYDLKVSNYNNNQFDGYKYSDFFDLDSLVNYFLINEISMNWDGMINSIFLYKDINDKAYMGPVWDYDLAYNNIRPNGSDIVFDTWKNLDNRFFQEEDQTFYVVTQWYVQLCKNKEFLNAVYEKYWLVRDTAIQDMIDSINTYREEIGEDCKKNDELWGYRYTMDEHNPNFNFDNTFPDYTSLEYEDSFDFLYQFLVNRINWMDKQMETKENFYDSIFKTIEQNNL